MNSIALSIPLRFVGLILLQVLILNNINFLGYINPLAYILFVAIYPINSNRTLFIFLAFIYGLLLDVFMDSGGIHATACVLIAYIRPVLLKFSFRTQYDHNSLKFRDTDLIKRILFITILTLIHHTTLFTLEIFNSSKIEIIVSKILYTSIFTISISVILNVLFTNQKK